MLFVSNRFAMEKNDERANGKGRKSASSAMMQDDSEERAATTSRGRPESFSPSRPGPSAIGMASGRMQGDRSGAPVGGNSFAIRGSAASMLERQQEEQRLRATQLMMQRRQQDDALLAVAIAKASGNMAFGGAQHSTMGAPTTGWPGLEEHLQALLQQQQQSLFHSHGLLQGGNLSFGGSRSAGLLDQQRQLDHTAIAASDRGHRGTRLSDPSTTQFASSRDMQGGLKKAPYFGDSSSHSVDPSTDPGDVADDEENYEEGDDEGESGGDEKKKPKGGTVEPFPQKLFRIVEEAEQANQGDIVSFFDHGRAFAIHKPRKFIADIMPKYFSTSRMSSFQRQLNLYGFRRITEGRDKGGYFHEFFLKGRKGLCKKIKRKKTTNTGKSQSDLLARGANDRMLSLGGIASSRLMLPAQFRQQEPNRIYNRGIQQMMMNVGATQSSWPAGATSDLLAEHQVGLPSSAPRTEGTMPNAATLMALSGHSPSAVALLGNNVMRSSLFGAGGNHDLSALRQPNAVSGGMRSSLFGAGGNHDLYAVNHQPNASAAAAALREQRQVELVVAQLRQQQWQEANNSGGTTGGGFGHGGMRGPPF